MRWLFWRSVALPMQGQFVRCPHRSLILFRIPAPQRFRQTAALFGSASATYVRRSRTRGNSSARGRRAITHSTFSILRRGFLTLQGMSMFIDRTGKISWGGLPSAVAREFNRPNQSMKPTRSTSFRASSHLDSRFRSPLRNNFSEFATTPWILSRCPCDLRLRAHALPP